MICGYMENNVTPCENPATFEIRDMGDSDPYSCYTHACDDHVGHLLGHRVGVPDDAQDLWEVYPYV